MSKRMSHETIYAAIYVIVRGELQRQLISCLRQHRKMRHRWYRRAERRGQIPNPTPDCRAAGRSRGAIGSMPLGRRRAQGSGPWLGGSQRGRAQHARGTARPYARAPLRQRDARLRAQTPHPLRKSMTYAKGHEMAPHEQLVLNLRLRLYYADPHNPWQQGTNEDTKGFPRQYLPKNPTLAPRPSANSMPLPNYRIIKSPAQETRLHDAKRSL
jgi:IS30 family transposase